MIVGFAASELVDLAVMDSGLGADNCQDLLADVVLHMSGVMSTLMAAIVVSVMLLGKG